MGRGGEERDDLSLVVSLSVVMVVPSVLPSYQSRNTNTNANDNVFSNFLSRAASGRGTEEEDYLLLCRTVVTILYNFSG